MPVSHTVQVKLLVKNFNPFTMTLIVRSHWDEIVATEEVPRDESLFTSITVNYPFVRWDVLQMRVTGNISTIYDSRTGSEEGARAWLQFVGDSVKDERYPRKLEISVVLKNEDDRADSDAPGGPSARGNPGHQGEDGPDSNPESWWRGGPGPVAGVGPRASARELPAALVEMRAILQAAETHGDGDSDYATANEDQSSDDAMDEDADSDAESLEA